MIPEKVKLGYRVYDVIKLPPHEMPISDEGKPLLGEIAYERNTIKLNNDLSDELLYPILIHEIVHGIFYMCGREEVHDERLCDAVAESLMQIAADNPALFSL